MNLLDETNVDPTIDPSKNYLDELVGEGKKFKTVQDLSRAKVESDLFIKTLEKRQDELRTEYLRVLEENKARARLEDLVDQLSKQKQPSSNEYTPPVNDEIPVLDPKKIEEIIDSRMQARDAERQYQDNASLVKDKLTERFGPNYQATVKEQITELGITVEEFNEMARRQPKVLLKTLGADQPVQKDPFQAPPKSQRISDHFAPNVQKRTWSYYQNLKKSDPVTYFDPKTTNQMHKDYEALGPAFEDGDFGAV